MAFAQPHAFANRTVIVTGGAGSIGRPLCLAFAASGANVVVNDLGGSADGQGNSHAAADSVVAEIKKLGGSAVADYNSVSDGDKIVAMAVKEFGGVDMVINNAGIIRYKSFEDHRMEDFRTLLEVNTLGAISLTLAAWPYMKKKAFGRIINFTSDSVFGMPNSASYIVSKSAMIGATRALALEGAEHGILVNAVAPVAYSRMAGETIPDKAQRYAFRDTYSGEGNVPMILALASEKNEYSGKVFSLGAWNVSELVLGCKAGYTDGKTMEKCLENKNSVLGVGKEIQEAADLNELMGKRMGFALGLEK